MLLSSSKHHSWWISPSPGRNYLDFSQKTQTTPLNSFLVCPKFSTWKGVFSSQKIELKGPGTQFDSFLQWGSSIYIFHKPEIGGLGGMHKSSSTSSTKIFPHKKINRNTYFPYSRHNITHPTPQSQMMPARRRKNWVFLYIK